MCVRIVTLGIVGNKYADALVNFAEGIGVGYGRCCRGIAVDGAEIGAIRQSLGFDLLEARRHVDDGECSEVIERAYA